MAFADALAKAKEDLAAAIAALPEGDPSRDPDWIKMVIEALHAWFEDDGATWGYKSNTRPRVSPCGYTTIDAAVPKCNVFVAEVIHEALGLLPEGSSGWPWQTLPPTAKEWAEGEVPGFTKGKPGDKPTAGAVISTGTHVGVYMGNGVYISARDDSKWAGLTGQHGAGVHLKTTGDTTFIPQTP